MACLQIRGKYRKRDCVWKRLEFYRGKSETLLPVSLAKIILHSRGMVILVARSKERRQKRCRWFKKICLRSILRTGGIVHDVVICSSYSVIVQVRVVQKRTVVGD